jgi:hypothetical protein
VQLGVIFHSKPTRACVWFVGVILPLNKLLLLLLLLLLQCAARRSAATRSPMGP